MNSAAAMTPEQFDREKNYQAALALARAMLKQGVISTGDFTRIEAYFGMKFCPSIGGFLGPNP